MKPETREELLQIYDEVQRIRSEIGGVSDKLHKILFKPKRRIIMCKVCNVKLESGGLAVDHLKNKHREEWARYMLQSPIPINTMDFFKDILGYVEEDEL
jgi:hypothetical protein